MDRKALWVSLATLALIILSVRGAAATEKAAAVTKTAGALTWLEQQVGAYDLKPVAKK